MKVQMTKLNAISEKISDHHKHVVVAKLNEKYLVTLAVNDETYPWHIHPNSDELLIVLEGTLVIELRDGQLKELRQHDSLYIPAGVEHRTLPQGRAVNLVVENIDTETVFGKK